MLLKFNNSIKKSFTLIELLLSVAIIIVAMTAFMTFFPIGVEAAKETVEKDRVEELSQQYIEYINLKLKSDWVNTITKFYSTIPQDNQIFNQTHADATFLSNVYLPINTTQPSLGLVQLKSLTNISSDSLIPQVIIDFGVEIRVSLSSPVNMTPYIEAGIGTVYPTPDHFITVLSTDQKAQATFEVTWPISEPRYDKRKKRTYTTLITRGN